MTSIETATPEGHEPDGHELGGHAPGRQRIAKLMARVGLCSRREAETWVVAGRVSVNGTVLTSPAVDVGLADRILVDGAPLPKAEKTRLFLFHKPRGLVTSDHDPEGRATVADFLREHWAEGPRVVTVGRLDINTEGLLLLTNDGGLARTLELPKTGWARRYRVRAKGETDQGVLDALRDGVTVDSMDYAGIEATLDRAQGANVWLTMGLREGKNREVKRVLESIGLEVNRLIRLSFGPFQLGDLAEGAVEEVRTRVLRDQLGVALAAAAGVVFEDAAPKTEPAPGPSQHERTAKSPREGRRPPARDDDRRPARRDERGGERPRRRPRDETPSAPPPLRERPMPGTRKHVSALRAAGTNATQHSPRRRIERSDVTDRNERAVRVERLVGTRSAATTPEPRRPRGPREDGGREDERHHGNGRRQAGRDGPDGRRAPKREHASPSALGKRTRIARSGGRTEDNPHDGPASDRRVRTRETKPIAKPRGIESRRSDRGARSETRPAGHRSDPKRSKPEGVGGGHNQRTDATVKRKTPSGRRAEENRRDGPPPQRRGGATEPRSIGGPKPRGRGTESPRSDRGERNETRPGSRASGPKRPKSGVGHSGRKPAENAAGRKAPRPGRGSTRGMARDGDAPHGKPHGTRRPPRGPAPRGTR